MAIIAIGAVTSRCNDYVNLSVLDEHGRKTCNATVTVSKDGGAPFELQSCYFTPLTDGHWTLRATQPGYLDTLSAIDVDHANDCTRYVQSVELTLTPVGAARPVFSRTLVPESTAPVAAPTATQASSAAPGSATPAFSASSPTAPAPATSGPAGSDVTAPPRAVFPN